MRAALYDPVAGEVVVQTVRSREDIRTALGLVLNLTSPRGHPTLELISGDSSSLSLSTDGKRAFLVFVSSLGESFHSAGDQASQPLVFDYFGSWSEAPAGCLVSLGDALRCAEKFVATGTAATDQVLFEPD